MKKMILSLFVIFVALFTFTSNVHAEDLIGDINKEANLEEELIGQNTKVVISKVNEKDEQLVGSKLQVLDLEGNILYEWTTDGNDFEAMLPAGKYILHEVEAPEGYEIAEDQEFEVEVIIEDEIIGDADMNKFPCDHGEDNASPMYYVEIKGVSYEVYCINQGLATPNGNDYNGQIITPDELREFTKQETNIDKEGYTTTGKYIYVNTETVENYDVSDQTMTNRELYDKVLDIIYHRYLALKDPRFKNLTVEEIRFVTEIALKNYLNAGITTYETVRVLNGNKISHVNHNTNGELWQDGDGTKYYKIYNKFYNREYLYDESSPTGYIISSGNGDSMGNFAKHYYHGHGNTKVPKIYVDLFYYLIKDESKHPESMQLFMYSPVSNLEDVFQNLLGITGYIEDLEVKSQSVKMLGNYSTETRDITVEKIWVDKNDDSKRPEEITVSLYADGVLLKEVKLSKENNWTYTFEGLEMYKDGMKIVYTILELEVPSYETTIEGDMEEGFLIVNKLVNETIPSGGIDEIENPKTFDNLYISILMIIISLVGITISSLKTKNL